MNSALWRLERVVVKGIYRPRLDVASLEIQMGTTAVLGISGAGKTTLLNLLCGFARPDGGRLEDRLPRENGRLPLFWVPQNDGLWPHCSVREHIEQVLDTAPAVTGRNGRPALRNSDDWLAAFDLSDHARKPPEQLSHGERNRLAIARPGEWGRSPRAR